MKAKETRLKKVAQELGQAEEYCQCSIIVGDKSFLEDMPEFCERCGRVVKDVKIVRVGIDLDNI